MVSSYPPPPIALAHHAQAALLRSIVAGPRLQHEEAGLDLCYVNPSSPTLIAMSMPAPAFPKKAYRNPLDEVISYLNKKHGDAWSIWEFRAEGTGYLDADVHHRIFHAPWPDHHPPPFALIPRILASMRNHLHSRPDAAAVVHCKAGKGRSGTVCCSYLIAEAGWTANDALARFTAARMRPGFGEGVSIPSQRRWVGYVELWANELDKTYLERRVRVTELQVWGLRPGVRVAVQGYVEEGKKIKTFHTFHRHERTTFDQQENDGDGSDAAIFRPKKRLILPTSDVNIDFERRSNAAYGWTMVTSIAHVWFNAYFEGKGHENGVFEIEWKAMDGIKGTERKGIKALEKLLVLWEAVEEGQTSIKEPLEGEEVPQPRKAETQPLEERDLGLKESPQSSTSRVDSIVSSPDGRGSMAVSETGPADPLLAIREQAPRGEDGNEVVVGVGADGAGDHSGHVIVSSTLENPTEEEPYVIKESRFGSIKRQHRDRS